MLTKVTATLLTILLTHQALATSDQGNLPFKLSDHCPPELQCECFTYPEINKIANIFKKYAVCDAQLKDAKAFIVQQAKQQQATVRWWQEPSVVAGGIVFSFFLGTTLVYLLKTK